MSAASPDHEPLDRAQRRLLRRIYNGRRTPILIDGTPLLTFREASRFLLALSPDARETAYAQMRRVGSERSAAEE